MLSNFVKKYITVCVLSLIIVAVTGIVFQLLSGVLVLNTNNSIPLKWRYTHSENPQELTNENVEWNESANKTAFLYDFNNHYVRYNTTIGELEEDQVLILEFQNRPIKVLINGKEVYDNGYSKKEMTNSKISRIHLYKDYSGAEIDVYTTTRYISNFSWGTEHYDGHTLNIFKMFGLFSGSILIALGLFVLLLSLFILTVKTDIKITTFLGLLLATIGAKLLTSTLAKSYVMPNWFNAYKINYSLVIISLIFCVCIVFCMQRNWTSWQKMYITFLVAYLVIFIAAPMNFFVFILNTIILFLPVICILTIICAMIALTKSTYEYEMPFFLIVVCLLLALAICCFLSFTHSLYINFEFAGLFALLLSAIQLYSKNKNNVLKDVRSDERKANTEHLSRWMDKVNAMSLKMFSSQDINAFCENMAEILKNIINDDQSENAKTENGFLHSIHSCVAIKDHGQYNTIYNDTESITCNFANVEKKFKSADSKSIVVNTTSIDVAIFKEGEIFIICHVEGLKVAVSDNLVVILKMTQSNISNALNSLNLKNEIFETQEMVFFNLATITEEKSHSTAAHIRRVSTYTKEMCLKYGMSLAKAEMVSKASMMHDLGKLAIREDLIKKKSMLTNAEFNIMKMHVVWGYNILSSANGEMMKAAAVIAQQHHERWDGSGYIGLVEEQIHEYARIVAVADVFDALTSERSYKETWTPDEARLFINKFSGTHFEEKTVVAFNNCFYKIMEIYNTFKD